MHWTDVDGLRAHLSGGQTKRDKRTGTPTPVVSRKTVYAMVDAGMKVAPRGDSGKRFWFCAEWVDEFLQASADKTKQPSSARRRRGGDRGLFVVVVELVDGVGGVLQCFVEFVKFLVGVGVVVALEFLDGCGRIIEVGCEFVELA